MHNEKPVNNMGQKSQDTEPIKCLEDSNKEAR